MAKSLLIDVYHLSVFVPRDLSDRACDLVRQTLHDPAFEAELRRRIREVFQQYPALDKARITVSR